MSRLGLVCFSILFLWGVYYNPLEAQEYKYELGGNLVTSYYIGDIGSEHLFPLQSFGIGFVGRYNPNLRWATRLELTYFGLRGDSQYTENKFPENRQLSFRTHHLQLGIAEEFNFFSLSDKYRYLNTRSWSPYIALGTGLLAKIGSRPFVLTPILEIGGGVKYKIDSRWTLTLSWMSYHTFSDKLDVSNESNSLLANPYATNQGAWKAGDGYGRLQLGVTYQIGERNPKECN